MTDDNDDMTISEICKKQEAQRCQNFVVCFKSSSLKPLGQLEPNLAGMCILDCPLERLCFCLLIRDTQNKQCTKDVLCSVYRDCQI
jgi:hypothetical protein